MEKETLYCAPCIEQPTEKPLLCVRRMNLSEEATSYSKSNDFNAWMGKNGNRVFYGAQLTGNVGLLVYAIMEKDVFTGITATNNLARNAYGIVSPLFKKDKSKNEKADGFIMGWGAISNSVQTLSFIGGAPITNAAAGGLATLTYGIRFGAHHLRKAGRRKELKANDTIKQASLNVATDYSAKEYLDRKQQQRYGIPKAIRSKKRSKLMRVFSYNAEKVAATSFLARGVMQFKAGMDTANEIGMGTGGLFVFGALGMLKGDFVKANNGKNRCFYANGQDCIRHIKDGKTQRFTELNPSVSP